MSKFTLNESDLSSTPTEPPPRPAINYKIRPTVIIVVGMAGSGKTTFLSRLYRYLSVEKKRVVGGGREREDVVKDALAFAGSSEKEKDSETPPPPASKSTTQPTPTPTPAPIAEGYYLNLDPAVKSMPFPPQLDIRDTIDYKGVMSSYKLGPNGAIMTCLNLYATRFDQVIGILESKVESMPHLEYVIIDTPGQIESFTWSSSGEIFTQSLASSFPTILTFVVDTPRCSDVNTFMSNMLYACSMLYRSRLPLLLAFNKSDLVDPEFAFSWMEDYEKFQEAMDLLSNRGGSNDGGGYYATLTRSMALTLDEFYTGLARVGVSAATGSGISEYFDKVDLCRAEFMSDYLPDLERRTTEQSMKRAAVGKKKEEISYGRLDDDLSEIDRVGGRPPRNKVEENGEDDESDEEDE